MEINDELIDIVSYENTLEGQLYLANAGIVGARVAQAMLMDIAELPMMYLYQKSVVDLHEIHQLFDDLSSAWYPSLRTEPNWRPSTFGAACQRAQYLFRSHLAFKESHDEREDDESIASIEEDLGRLCQLLARWMHPLAKLFVGRDDESSLSREHRKELRRFSTTVPVADFFVRFLGDDSINALGLKGTNEQNALYYSMCISNPDLLKRWVELLKLDTVSQGDGPTIDCLRETETSEATLLYRYTVHWRCSRSKSILTSIDGPYGHLVRPIALVQDAIDDGRLMRPFNASWKEVQPSI